MDEAAAELTEKQTAQLNESKEMSTSPVAVFAQGNPALKVGEADTNIVDQGEENVKGKSSPETETRYSIQEDS